MVTLHNVVKRNFPVFPFICVIGTGSFTFQSRIFPYYQTVYICNHKWMCITSVHIIGTTYLETSSFHKTLCHILFQIMPLPYGFIILLLLHNTGLVPEYFHGTTKWIYSTNSSGIRTTNPGFS